MVTDVGGVNDGPFQPSMGRLTESRRGDLGCEVKHELAG